MVCCVLFAFASKYFINYDFCLWPTCYLWVYCLISIYLWVSKTFFLLISESFHGGQRIDFAWFEPFTSISLFYGLPHGLFWEMSHHTWEKCVFYCCWVKYSIDVRFSWFIVAKHLLCPCQYFVQLFYSLLKVA